MAPEKTQTEWNQPAYTPAEVEAKISVHGELVTLAVAAELLGISVRSLQREIAAGRLRSYRVGRTRAYRVRTSEVLALLKRVA